MRVSHVVSSIALGAIAVLCMAPGRCGEAAGGFFSDMPAPDLRGQWVVEYDDDISVDIYVGGELLHSSVISGAAGSFGFEYESETYTFELDCELPGVVCPSEVFPDTIQLEQRQFEDRPHQVHMPASETNCTGASRPLYQALGECGGETGVDCSEGEVCEGVVTTREAVALGSISVPSPEPQVGDTPDYVISVALGASIGGFTTPLGACVGLSGTNAQADIEYSGSYDPDSNAMVATRLANGEIVVTLAGACLFAAEGGGHVAAALAGATVQIYTGFTATPQ